MTNEIKNAHILAFCVTQSHARYSRCVNLVLFKHINYLTVHCIMYACIILSHVKLLCLFSVVCLCSYVEAMMRAQCYYADKAMHHCYLLLDQ